MSAANPVVSVIIPTYNRSTKLIRCVESVLRSDFDHFEVIVVDDGSDCDLTRDLRNYPVKVVRNPWRKLLAYSRNFGAENSTGQYLFFLDDDNIVAPDAVGALLEPLQSERIAVSAPIIFYLGSPQRVWTSYVLRSKFPGFYTLHTDFHRGTMVTFSFHNSFMVKRSVFEKLGGFDFKNFPIRFSEVDFAHKLHSRGLKAVVTSRARVWHDLGWALVNIDSTRAYYTERNRMIVLKRYYSKKDFYFYASCILPFITGYYLLHHPLSTSDSRIRTASSLLRGVVSGLTFKEDRDDLGRYLAEVA